MFAAPLISSSRGVVTESAVTPALAPMNWVVTCTWGGTSGGYCEIGRVSMATAPAITMRKAIAAAKIGRSMKKFMPRLS